MRPAGALSCAASAQEHEQRHVRGVKEAMGEEQDTRGSGVAAIPRRGRVVAKGVRPGDRPAADTSHHRHARRMVLPNLPGIKRAPVDALLAEIVARGSDDAIASKTLKASSPAGMAPQSACSATPQRRSSGSPLPCWPRPGVRTRYRGSSPVSGAASGSATSRRCAAAGTEGWSRSRSPSRRCATRRGRIVSASKIARDISERNALDERQRLLLGELRHRVKEPACLGAGIGSPDRGGGQIRRGLSPTFS